MPFHLQGNLPVTFPFATSIQFKLFIVGRQHNVHQ